MKPDPPGPRSAAPVPESVPAPAPAPLAESISVPASASVPESVAAPSPAPLAKSIPAPILLRGRTRPARASERGGIFFRLISLIVFVAFCGVLYLLRFPLLHLAGQYWVVDDAPERCDAIVLLGDDNYFADRAERAAELYRANWASHIVASGRYLRPYASVPELMQHDLVERGIPAEAIVRFPHKAANTAEEIAALGPFLLQHNWRSVIIVTSNYHTRRAQYICRHLFPSGTQFRMAAAHDSDFDPQSWWHTRIGIKLFLHELLGMAVALWDLRQAPSNVGSNTGSTAPHTATASTAF